MNESRKAVFLSYASQDAEAARRICDALRAEGLEVWFDKSELRGGDAWDASIRRQIKECALFVPVISATTNSRSEGYFRLEWKLAVERSHLMADDQPFLLPVVIDDTPDGGARVPDAFRARQWTRLPDGEASPAFCAQVKRLLDDAMAPETPPPPRKQSVTAQPAPSSAPLATARPAGKRSLAIPVAAALALVAVVAGLFAWQPWKPASAPSAAGSTAAPATPAASSETIAVLPFANLNPEKAEQHFADGFSEEILNTLSRIPGLRVTARTASFSFKGKDATTSEIAAKLGVNYVVEGSVRRTGDQARITVQLVKGSDGFQAWSETYTREVKDLFSVQNDVALRVAGALKLRLGAAAEERLASRATQNPAAYDAYLRGHEAMNRGMNRGRVDDQRDAIRLLLEAVTLDPGFALAHGKLAEAHISLGNWGVEPRDKIYSLAKASAERALALDPRNVQAHTALGEHAFHYAWDWEESDRHLREALAIDPNYFMAVSHLADHGAARNRLEEALASFRRVKELNPFAGNTAHLRVLIQMKRYDEAILLARQDIAESPASPSPRYWLAQAQFLNGQREEGLRALEALNTPGTAHLRRSLANLGWFYGVAGQKDKARAILKQLEEGQRDSRVVTFELALVQAGLGERDRAFELLERAYEQRSPWMPYLGNTYMLDPIRDDPRFRDLLKRMKLDAYFPEAPVR